MILCTPEHTTELRTNRTRPDERGWATVIVREQPYLPTSVNVCDTEVESFNGWQSLLAYIRGLPVYVMQGSDGALMAKCGRCGPMNNVGVAYLHYDVAVDVPRPGDASLLAHFVHALTTAGWTVMIDGKQRGAPFIGMILDD